MAELLPTFKDFGIVPEDAPAPAGKIRCSLTTRQIVPQYIATGIASALGLGLMVVLALTMPVVLAVLGCGAVVAGFGAVIYFVTRDDYHWIELEGNTLRAKHLYTRRVLEQVVSDLAGVNTINFAGNPKAALTVDSLLDQVVAMELRFRNSRTPLRVHVAKPAMHNAKSLVKGVLYRMKQAGDLESEFVAVHGRPLALNIHWGDQQPSVISDRTANTMLVAFQGAVLLLGTIFAWGYLQAHERYAMSLTPAQEIGLQSLIENGPGSNRHLIITDFREGGYAYEVRSGDWTGVWVALFPAGGEQSEIKAVLESRTISGADELQRMLQGGRIDCICPAEPSSHWGAKLGPDLRESNEGCQLSSAWRLQDLSKPPTEEEVARWLAESEGCFAAAIILGVVAFWRAAREMGQGSAI